MRFGWLASRALHTAAEPGVADLLSDGAKTIDQLAEATSTHRQSLYRLLRMLAGHGVFEEDSSGRFHLTPVGSLLRSGALRDAARMFGEAEWNAFGSLPHCIKTGEPTFQHLHGVGFFEYLARNPDGNSRFDEAMASLATAENSVIAKAYDFGRFNRIVDVGGGRGGLIAEILKAHPAARGVLSDLPQVVERPDYLIAAGVEDRCEIEAANFFESVPRGGDAYILKRVIHDWTDEIAEAILRRCRDAVIDGGRILVIEALLPAGNTPHPSKDSDLLMMALLGGRERSEPEFRQLFESASIKLNRIISTDSLMSIIEGQKKT